MKKEGIQTRNRKLSSKSKKKKAGGCLGLGGVMGDMIKASGHLDLDNKPFHSGFGSPMGTSQHHHTMHPAMQHYMYHTGVGVAGGLHQGFAPPAPPPIHPHSHSHSHSHHMTSLQGLQLAATTNAMVSARLLPSSAIDQRLRRPPIIDQDLPRGVSPIPLGLNTPRLSRGSGMTWPRCSDRSFQMFQSRSIEKFKEIQCADVNVAFSARTRYSEY